MARFDSTLLSLVDRLSTPAGRLLDTVIDRVLVKKTASAASYYCGYSCGSFCDRYGDQFKYDYYASSVWDCQNHTNLQRVSRGCLC